VLIGVEGNERHSPAAQEIDMDKDRIAGAAKEIKGALKDAAGKIIGNEKLQAEGKSDKLAGKVQNALGQVKDDVIEALRTSARVVAVDDKKGIRRDKAAPSRNTAEKIKAAIGRKLMDTPREMRAAGERVADHSVGKREPGGPMEMQPRREGDIIPASDTRRDAPGADVPKARP
jgi:uncharacterized protein YjbJ (UPF0337 family)